MSQPFTHLDESGDARMVDITGKQVTERVAIARGRVSLGPHVVAALRDGSVPKGDALAVARLAAIQGAKRTADLIPLCHPIAIHGVDVDIDVDDSGATITVTVRTADRTGIEMEAMTAVAVGALALIDMVKGMDRSASIEGVALIEKRGGKSGTWTRT